MTRMTAELRSWVVLMALTVASVAIVENGGWAKAAIVAMFLIAAAKAELVAAQYMEIGHAASHWRLLYRIWIVLVAGMLIAGHFFA